MTDRTQPATEQVLQEHETLKLVVSQLRTAHARENGSRDIIGEGNKAANIAGQRQCNEIENSGAAYNQWRYSQ
jgi:hypothetical protein